MQGCHLEAALALWKYCEDSAQFIFGAATGNQVADRILKALRNAPAGLTRTEIRDLFGGHKSSKDTDGALNVLAGRNLAACVKEGSGGRAVERWTATSSSTQTPGEGLGA